MKPDARITAPDGSQWDVEQKIGKTDPRQLERYRLAHTLRERRDLIVCVLRWTEQDFPFLSASAVMELALATLARDHGLVVDRDEVTRLLAEAAGFAH